LTQIGWNQIYSRLGRAIDMGRTSPRSSRHPRIKGPRASIEISHDGLLKIVIATAPRSTATGVTVEGDVRLVRAALLYADQVELISPGTLMITTIAAPANQGPDFVFQLMDALDDDTLRHLGFDGDIAEMRTALSSVRQLNGLPRAERRKRLGPAGSREIRAMVDEMAGRLLNGETGLQAVANQMWEQAGAQDLAVAAEAGLLTVSTDAFEVGAPTGLQMDQFLATLRRLLADPSSHLMFDDQIAGMVTAMLSEDQAVLHPLAETHARRVATGTGLLARLPAFPDADMSSILEVRSELSEPLIRYRRGIVDLSARLTSGPLDLSLEAEIDDLWRDDVLPTLNTLRAELSTTRLVRGEIVKTCGLACHAA
jgi:hypothetical protein